MVCLDRTGNTPVDLVAPLHSRDYFIDGPLGALDKNVEIGGTSFEWNATLSPIASGSFVKLVGEYDGLAEASDAVIANISRPIQQAHERGIQSRYWESRKCYPCSRLGKRERERD